MRRPIRLLLAGALVLTGCSALIGVNDIFLDPNAALPGEGGASETGTSDGPLRETGSEGGTCTADLQVDKKNCGRCGHDCLGGNCAAGKCELVALAGSLAAPTALALDATYVYVANSGDNTVVRIPKTGGNVEQLVTGWSTMLGVTVSGTSLFWSSNTGFGDGGGGNFGGLWTCTLPACTDKKNVSTAGYVRHLDARNGYVYYGTMSDVRRVKADGTAEQILAPSVNQTWSVAADATHVYYNSNQNSLQRVLVGGGGEEPVGPLIANYVGFVAVDSQRFYWAYVDVSKKGQILSGLKTAPATRVTYGNANEGAVGVASDETNLYWSNDGTATGIESNGDGELLTCPVAGCTGDPVRLADKLHYAGAIVTDATAVYFLEFGGRSGANGRLLKIAK